MVCNVLLPSSSSSCDHVYIIRIYIHSLLQGTGSLHTCHSLSISLSLSHSLSLSLSLLPIHAYLFRVCFASFSRKLASHACFVHAVLLFCHSSNRDYSNSVSFLRFYLSSYRLFYLTYFFFFCCGTTLGTIGARSEFSLNLVNRSRKYRNSDFSLVYFPFFFDADSGAGHPTNYHWEEDEIA